MIPLPRVLVVEDEKDVRELILIHLRRAGLDPIPCENGEKALKFLEEECFDLVVLDWMLPSLSGLEICKKMAGKIPILMLTARANSTDVIEGLEAGADDFITKPFEIPIFIARVHALLRRQSILLEKDSDTLIQIEGLKVDLNAHRVLCDAFEIQLTHSEFKLLSALVRNRGRVLSREKLMELVQGQGVAVIDRTIDTHVFGLRKKLGECSEVIETIRGVGYRVKSQ